MNVLDALNVTLPKGKAGVNLPRYRACVSWIEPPKLRQFFSEPFTRLTLGDEGLRSPIQRASEQYIGHSTSLASKS